MFTRFGGMSDARVKAQLARGERLRALLAQPQYAPLRLVDEMALAFALREGMLDARQGGGDRRAARGAAGAGWMRTPPAWWRRCSATACWMMRIRNGCARRWPRWWRGRAA